MAKVKYGNWDLVKELENYERDMERWVKRGIAKTTAKIHNTIISLMPVDTGYLRESVTMDFKDGGFTGVINIGSEYAIYVNYGTGIYSTGAGGSRAKRYRGHTRMQTVSGTLLKDNMLNLLGAGNRRWASIL